MHKQAVTADRADLAVETLAVEVVAVVAHPVSPVATEMFSHHRDHHQAEDTAMEAHPEALEEDLAPQEEADSALQEEDTEWPCPQALAAEVALDLPDHLLAAPESRVPMPATTSARRSLI